MNRRTFPCILGDDVTVGHAAIVHACTVEDGGFVGMGATVMDGAVIEAGGVLAAGALLPPGKRVGRNELWMGAPARFLRVLGEEERVRFAGDAAHYVELAARHRAGRPSCGRPNLTPRNFVFVMDNFYVTASKWA